MVGESDFGVVESEGAEERGHLFTGVVFCQSLIRWCEATRFHLPCSLLVHLFLGCSVPCAALVEGAGAGLVNEMFRKKGDGWKGEGHGVSVRQDPSVLTLREVNTQSQCSVIDSHKTVVARQGAVADSVHQFLIG